MNLLVSHPDIAKQWHPVKNGDLKPENFTRGSGKKIWWMCDKSNCIEHCIHDYEATIRHRTNGDGCPFCSNHKLCIHNSIKYTHPNVVKEWHPFKNGDLNPENYKAGSNKKIWWLCPNICKEGCCHEWETVISRRCLGIPSGCPFCSTNKLQFCIHDSLKYTHPDISKQWHPTKNGDLKPESFTSGSSKKIWWLCEKTCFEGCNHEWETTISSRKSGFSCPFCCSPQQKICKHESIKFTHPQLAIEWHPTKNNTINIEEIKWGTHQIVWWKCSHTCNEGCIHEWKAEVKSRIYGNSCPYCCIPTKQFCIHQSILYTNPDLIKEWHPTKNGDLKPENFTYGSTQKIWWICNQYKSHEWNTSIGNRRITGCPDCINKTEDKLYNELIKYYVNLKRQFKVDWCINIRKLPFDFILEDNKIIIELDGLQHFKDIQYFKSIFIDRHKTDKYKMKCANDNGCSVIRLLQSDVFYDTYNWLEELKTNIEKIKNGNIVQNIYMCKDNEYDIFQTLQLSLE